MLWTIGDGGKKALELLVLPELSPASGGSSGRDRLGLVRLTFSSGHDLLIPGTWQLEVAERRGKGQICDSPQIRPVPKMRPGPSQKHVQSAGPANEIDLQSAGPANEIVDQAQIAAEIAELNLLAKQARKERRSEEANRRVARSGEEGDRSQTAVQQGAPFDQPEGVAPPEASRSRPSGRSGQGKSRPTPPRAGGAGDHHEVLWRRHPRLCELDDDHSPERSDDERFHCEARPAPRRRRKANRCRSAISLEELIQADLRAINYSQMDPSRREMVPAATPRTRDRPGWDADEVGAWR